MWWWWHSLLVFSSFSFATFSVRFMTLCLHRLWYAWKQLISQLESSAPLTVIMIAIMLWMLKSGVCEQHCLREPFEMLSFMTIHFFTLFELREWVISLVYFSQFDYPTTTCFLFPPPPPPAPPPHLNILKHFRARRRPGGPGLCCVCAPQMGYTFKMFPLSSSSDSLWEGSSS